MSTLIVRNSAEAGFPGFFGIGLAREFLAFGSRDTTQPTQVFHINRDKSHTPKAYSKHAHKVNT